MAKRRGHGTEIFIDICLNLLERIERRTALPMQTDSPESSVPDNDPEVINDVVPVDDSGADEEDTGHHPDCQCDPCHEARSFMTSMYVEDFEGDWVAVNMKLPRKLVKGLVRDADGDLEIWHKEAAPYVRAVVEGTQNAMTWAEETNWGRDEVEDE